MGDRLDIEAALDEVARGRTEVFGQIVRAYALPLRGFLAAQVPHLDDVDDLAQEVFLAALEGLAGFRRGDDFGAWLRGIARNKLLVYFRSVSRRNAAFERFRAEVSRTVAEDLEQATSQRAAEMESLLRCIAQLPERLRRVVRSGLAGHRPAALAEEWSTTVGAIYNLHYRAHQLLRDCLRKELS